MKKTYIICLVIMSIFILNMGYVKAADVDSYNNVDSTSKVFCGGADNKTAIIKNIPSMFPKTINIIYIGLEIAVPVLLALFGMIDLIKAIISGKEDELKKHQMVFVRRLVTAILTFFVFAIVKLLINIAADNNKTNILDCVKCFISYDVNKDTGKCGS